MLLSAEATQSFKPVARLGLAFAGDLQLRQVAGDVEELVLGRMVCCLMNGGSAGPMKAWQGLRGILRPGNSPLFLGAKVIKATGAARFPFLVADDLLRRKLKYGAALTRRRREGRRHVCHHPATSRARSRFKAAPSMDW